jgi:hypothetical protein
MKGLSRYLATVRVSKHRYFVWLPITVLPDTRLNVIAQDDDYVFGLLSSRMHEVWALANSSVHGGNTPTYNATSCFETFPFPKNTNKEITDAVRTAAVRLDTLRESWLNPYEWVDWIITPQEEIAAFPRRGVAKFGYESELKKRTLTNLYNQRPSWLDSMHKELDLLIAEAYGWNDYTPKMEDDEVLRRLLKLNLERSSKE